ncbi:hypothetical protein ACHWQZ_G003999 [Mnemiopsis leidyi]
MARRARIQAQRHPVAPRSLEDLVLPPDYIRTNKGETFQLCRKARTVAVQSLSRFPSTHTEEEQVQHSPDTPGGHGEGRGEKNPVKVKCFKLPGRVGMSCPAQSALEDDLR